MRVSLVAAVSTDRFGQRLTADLVADGVDDTYIQRREEPTTLAVADLDLAGGASYRFYLDGTSAPTVTATELPAGTRALVAGGLGVAVEPMASAVEQMVVEAADDVLVLVDVNCRPTAITDRDLYRQRLDRVLATADVVKASVDDLGYIDPATPAAAVATRLLTRRTRAVLMTAGPAATTVLTRAGQRIVPVHDAPVIDSIGAGDTFTASFLVWWMTTGRVSTASTTLMPLRQRSRQPIRPRPSSSDARAPILRTATSFLRSGRRRRSDLPCSVGRPRLRASGSTTSTLQRCAACCGDRGHLEP
jgi:fructokinase